MQARFQCIHPAAHCTDIPCKHGFSVYTLQHTVQIYHASTVSVYTPCSTLYRYTMQARFQCIHPAAHCTDIPCKHGFSVYTLQHTVQIYHASTVSVYTPCSTLYRHIMQARFQCIHPAAHCTDIPCKHGFNVYYFLCVSVDGQKFGEVMWERRESGFKPSIHAPSDSLFAKTIKTVIDDMIEFKPADRPSARQVVQKLEELQAVMWQIGKFEVIKKDSNILGRGEMATVFLGEHPATREQVAVKEVSVNVTSQSSEKFEEEGKTAMTTPPHKNVLKIHGVYSDHHRNISLVTELCQFGSLQHYVKNTSLTLDQKIDIILASVEALAHLHKQKPQSKLYRDIRPENMILSGTALEPVIKLSPVSVTRITKSEEDGLVVLQGPRANWTPRDELHSQWKDRNLLHGDDQSGTSGDTRQIWHKSKNRSVNKASFRNSQMTTKSFKIG